MPTPSPFEVAHPATGCAVPERATGARWLRAGVVGSIVVVGLYLTSRYNYLLFHSLVEVYSIAIAFAIFIVAWNARDYDANPYLSVIGVAYLFIGFLDLLHTLAYKGMPIFTDYDYYANQLWIATRYLESTTLLGAFAALGLRGRPDLRLTFALYAAVTAVIVATVFVWRVFPVCFVEGQGLTPFKKWSEYIISGVLALGITCLVVLRQRFRARIFWYLFASMLASVGSELAFTFYISNYGFSNLVGHYFKLLSFYLIYKAVVQTAIREPYDLVFRELRLKEQELGRLALVDELTGLFNRRAAFDLLGRTLSGAQRHGETCTVGYLDLDGLKAINDRFGHRAGDQAIEVMGTAIREAVREMDYGCRVGGDEFLLVFPNCSLDQAWGVVERLREVLRERAAAVQLPQSLEFSCGLATYPGHGPFSADRLVEQADRLMYQTKAAPPEAPSAVAGQLHPRPT